ncbi:hypothetical protein BOSEA31B_11491 [Hyphomicrobiales bacterium]|nr:hypothetical protein BOSEA31B_11491 [Hyphomicrobiales bacterium]CAH1697287.1 hypothetical protein BOSEA1005_10324 [Hyphomicrobiales bacterium]CAI0342854.1 hypothetical protein BO1005MUT1_10147 [Hyphomicrobiales bacterium]
MRHAVFLFAGPFKEAAGRDDAAPAFVSVLERPACFDRLNARVEGGELEVFDVALVPAGNEPPARFLQLAAGIRSHDDVDFRGRGDVVAGAQVRRVRRHRQRLAEGDNLVPAICLAKPTAHFVCPCCIEEIKAGDSISSLPSLFVPSRTAPAVPPPAYPVARVEALPSDCLAKLISLRWITEAQNLIGVLAIVHAVPAPA